MGQHIRDLQKLSMLPLSVGNVGALRLMRNCKCHRVIDFVDVILESHDLRKLGQLVNLRSCIPPLLYTRF